jgi:acyl-CoA reductase-like NAD-dependent aldehyde dehydrogenase
MAAFDWDAELNPADRDALIDRCARIVADHKMGLPAILFLEMHRPLGSLAAQSLILASGFLAPLVGPQRVREMARLLESPDSIERLIARIEALSLPEQPAHAELPQPEKG